jgi:hypothetical protein
MGEVATVVVGVVEVGRGESQTANTTTAAATTKAGAQYHVRATRR